VRREALGGLSTFLTMAYILIVNPAILSQAGVPFAGVAVATALAAAVCTLGMGLIANLPFGLASGLGLNAVVAFDLILGRHLSWPVAMACVVLQGVLSFVLVLGGFRQAIMHALPTSLKMAIAVGIGLFIALIGLRNGGIVHNDPATGLALAKLTSGPALISLAGIAVAAAVAARKLRGGILAGIVTTTVLGIVFGVLHGPTGVAAMPHSSSFATIGHPLAPHNLSAALTWALIPTIFALFMSGFFDTIGTSTGLATAADLIDDNDAIPRMGRMLLVDSAADSIGGALGVSAVTTFVESSAGIAEGARTGLAAVVTAALFALAIFFEPLIALFAQQIAGPDKGNFISPAIAPALVMAGSLMITLVRHIDWTDSEVSIPAFLIITGIPFTFSISAGIGLGILAYAVIRVAKGKVRAMHPLLWVLVAMFAAYFIHGAV
jgi:AGZA family xanthine/uracil permease-like MFS transporter